MNKFKLFITTDNQPNNIDKKLSSKIKKFSSERNLFFAGIYSNNHAGGTPAPLPAEKAPSKLEKTKTFCKNGLLKKCKSLRELYQQHNNPQPNNQRSAERDIEKSTFKNLDDFERNYLSSGKRDLVNELKKNFENQQRNENNAHKPPLAPSATRKEAVKSLREKRSPEFAINSPVESQRGCITRHSFYTSSPMVTTMQSTTQPHSISDSNNDFMSISEYELIESFERKPGWTQSALNLSTVTSLGAPPTPIPARLNAKSSQTVYKTIATTPIDNEFANCTNDNDVVDDFIKQRRCSISDYNANNKTATTNNRLMNGDTMSLCELNLYPIYMQNICDTRTSGKFNTNNSSSGYGSSSISSDLNYGCGGMLKKYSSVNQIDLNVLKNELDDFVDMTTTSFSRNCGIQRSMPMVATRRKVCL